MNSLVAQNKISLLAASKSVYRYDIICTSECFWDSSISDNDNVLRIWGYDLIRADHTDNIKKGRCLFIIQDLALRKIKLLHITECVLCEVTVKW